jgi:hypothetical protein
LAGRRPPDKVKIPKERQVEFERAWRLKIGDDRFERILELIGDMAGETLDRPNVVAGQALWAAARRRRAVTREQ